VIYFSCLKNLIEHHTIRKKNQTFRLQKSQRRKTIHGSGRDSIITMRRKPFPTSTGRFFWRIIRSNCSYYSDPFEKFLFPPQCRSSFCPNKVTCSHQYWTHNSGIKTGHIIQSSCSYYSDPLEKFLSPPQCRSSFCPNKVTCSHQYWTQNRALEYFRGGHNGGIRERVPNTGTPSMHCLVYDAKSFTDIRLNDIFRTPDVS